VGRCTVFSVFLSCFPLLGGPPPPVSLSPPAHPQHSPFFPHPPLIWYEVLLRGGRGGVKNWTFGVTLMRPSCSVVRFLKVWGVYCQSPLSFLSFKTFPGWSPKTPPCSPYLRFVSQVSMLLKPPPPHPRSDYTLFPQAPLFSLLGRGGT